MKYDCKDIVEALENQQARIFDEEAFLEHIESCPRCASLAALDGNLENELFSMIPTAAPESVSENILAALATEKKKHQKDINRRRVLNAVVAVTFLTGSLIVIINIGRSLPGLPAFGAVIEEVLAIIASFQMPDLNIKEMLSILVNSPLITATQWTLKSRLTL